MKRRLRPKRRKDALSARVRALLVRTLYTQPASLAIGAVNGIAVTAVAAYVAGLTVLYWGCLLLSVIAVMRVLAATALSPDANESNSARLELLYEIGAFSYAFVLGAIAAVTMVSEASAAVEMLTVANALGYGIAICGRNAGRPGIALGQLALVSLPIMAACLLVGTLPAIALFLTIVLLLPAMASITLNLFTVLKDSIASAETNADLARKMQRLARTDPVTGLANRAGLDHALTTAVGARSPPRTLALFWIDLDRFKEVNDLLGHPVGDKVLIEISTRLRELAPHGSTVARFGGDEFIVLCAVADRRESERLASEIHAEIMRAMTVGTDRIEVRASLGVALFPEDARDADSLMQHADLALYHAKVGGRAQTRFFTAAMTRDLIRRREIEEELRKALVRDELSIFFQPIVDLASGRIRCFEALVRWFHPEKGELMPDEFIPVAEESGVIVTLGNWITAQAAKAAARWPDDVSVAVNLSPLQIRAPGAALGILNALREAGLDPTRLELEVTESLFVDDNHATAAFIETLSEKGVKFALDDFGTGYSSLGYINKFPFSKIKVDRSFISGDNVGAKSEAIIRAVAEMGAQLDMEIVAEGLETLDQVRSVRAAGCTLGQGYYFSRAVPDYLAANLLALERAEDEPNRSEGDAASARGRG